MISTNYIKKGTDQVWVGGGGREEGRGFLVTLSLSLWRREAFNVKSFHPKPDGRDPIHKL